MIAYPAGIGLFQQTESQINLMHPIVEFLNKIDRDPGQSPQRLLDTILRECRNFTDAEAGTIFLVHTGADSAWLEPVSLQNDILALEPKQLVVPVDETSIAGFVAVTGESLIIDDVYAIAETLPYGFNTSFDEASGYRTQSVACVALRRADGAVSAVVQLLNRRAADGTAIGFEPDQTEFIAAAGVVMTDVIDRAEMLEQLAESNRELKNRNTEIEALQQVTEAARLTAKKSDRAKSEFLNCIGHELKTPLNAIIGFSELLNNEGFWPLGRPSYKTFAGEVSDGGCKLLGIVTDILGIVQAETRSIECGDDSAAAYGCIEDTCRACFDEAAEKNIVFAVEFSDDPASCAVDAANLKTILERLIDNAVKFTQAGGEIRLDAGPHAGGLKIEISDTGIGMTDTEIVKALAPFGQADNSLSRGYEGAGLGLTLASALTRSMNGEFAIESDPGKGTTIAIMFPGSTVALSAPPAFAAAPAAAMWVSG
jgi:signal transduction histidine kinase